MIRNKKLNKGLRIGIIAAAWLVYLLLGIVANSSDDTSDPERKAPSDDVLLTFSSYDVEDQLYQDVVVRFNSIGLENIELVPIEDLITGWLTKDGEIEKVTINGDDYFYKGQKVKKDALIRITYHTFPGKETIAETVPISDIVTEEITVPATEAPLNTEADHVYYSTNDLKTAKKGNSGVFSYVKQGKVYDIYIIIDFDEGYYYYFLERDGNTFCDRLRIDEGDLNSHIIVTYHDGGDEWQNLLYFKYANQPDHLILLDGNHLEFDFYPTDLEKALKIRETKTIHDY